MDNYREYIASLLSKPDELMKKKPFTRGSDRSVGTMVEKFVNMNETLTAKAPTTRRYVVSQDTFLRELDPECHDVLFDDNIPSICVKINDDDFREVKFSRMSLPIQKNIKNKQLLHLSGHPMQFTLMESSPTKGVLDNFILFKQYWELRNQDGMKNKMVDTQLSLGDAGLLYYFDRYGSIKSRILSYSDGYVLCPHNDHNGDRILESVYYVRDDVEYIDSYDDVNMYRHKRAYASEDGVGWVMETPVPHGFNEIPLITKRGEVAWNGVQHIIESYEILYNVFNAIQRRLGWGILYIKGRFAQNGEKINGSVILNDTSIEGKGDAKYLTPPSPEGTIDTLQLMMDNIQLGSSTTFILPKDLKTGGDLAGITVQLVQSLDIENALQKVIEWQNVADKMVRLFKFGLAKELVNKGINPTAITDFEKVNICGKFKVWKPMNDYEYNQMITILTGAGILSKESGIELNTLSKPDEKVRVKAENDEAMAKAEAIAQQNVAAESEEDTDINQDKEEEGE